jgi:hypothetical protein
MATVIGRAISEKLLEVAVKDEQRARAQANGLEPPFRDHPAHRPDREV